MINRLRTICFALVVCMAITASVAIAGAENVSAELGKASNVGIDDFDDIFSFNIDPDAAPKALSGATGFVIAVDGKDILYVATGEDAAAVLNGIVAKYTAGSEAISDVSFAEEVTYREESIVTKEDTEIDESLYETYICTVDEAVNYIINGTSTPLTYTVQSGDSLWTIAQAHNMSVYDLMEMNPGADKSLHIGDTVYLYEKKPFVHVTFTEEVTEHVAIPFDTVYAETDTLYVGQTQIKSEGQKGDKIVTTKYTKTNGVVVASEVLAEVVLSEPVAQVSFKGTAPVPVKAGSGQFMYPTAHVEISSGWGASRSGGKRSHKGIDLRNPSGTPFMAADAGTVTFAGWGGNSYGNLITIDHGNGFVTKYAHCASISVSAGQNVSKGQTIGTVGSTGNATGYVLHFEIVDHGVQRNPVNYL